MPPFKFLSRAALLCGNLLLLSGIASAQECKYEKNETDKFTRQRSLLTEPLRIASKNIKLKGVYNIAKVDMQLKAESTQRSLLLTLFFNKGLTMANQNNTLLLLLSNGETVELPCLGNIPSTRYKASGVAVFTFEFGIDEEVYKKLSTANITDVRLASMVNKVEFSVEEGTSTYPLFRCIR